MRGVLTSLAAVLFYRDRQLIIAGAILISEANAKDGIAIDWPIRYKDLEPWYDYVEGMLHEHKRSKEKSAHLPDGKVLPPMDLNCAERYCRQAANYYKGQRQMIMVVLQTLRRKFRTEQSASLEIVAGRLPFGGYFSTHLPLCLLPRKTGKLVVRPGALLQN